MHSLNIQNTPQGIFVTYKLRPDEMLDRMTMGMLTNNQIKGIIPVVYSQVDDERWMKYEVTSMIPLNTYLLNVLTRQKMLELLEQVIDVFILAEDYMIDASFIVLNQKDVFVNPVTGEIGILCLPVMGYVCDVTLRSFFASVMGTAQVSSRDNRDYVVQIQSFVNGGKFSIAGFKKMLEELIHGSVQRVQREKTDEAIYSMEEVSSQMAVAVEAVAQMTNQNRENKGMKNAARKTATDGVLIPEAENGQVVPKTVTSDKPEKERKGLFGRKKKEKKQKKTEMAPGIAIPGMSVPGMLEPIERSQTALKDTAPEPVVSREGPGPTTAMTSQNLSSIADSISGGRIGVQTIAENKPEWHISPDYNEVAISDATVYLDVGQTGGAAVSASQEPPAVLQRVRTGEMITLGKDEFILGKDAGQVDYCISNNGTISRVHARIIRKNKQYFIMDENSLNHTYVNERPVAPAQEYPLMNHSSIRLSDEEFLFTVL